MDLDTILTIYNADPVQKELIRALACEARAWRDRCRTVERELDSAQKALDSMTDAYNMELETNAKLFAQVTELEQAASTKAAQGAEPNAEALDALLKDAQAKGARVRVTLAAPCDPSHRGTLTGVPFCEPWATDDVMPWRISSYRCGTGAHSPDDRIIAVELM